MAHYQYQRMTGSGGAEQVYTSSSLVTPPANPADTTKSAVAYSLTTREIDRYRDTVSLIWRKAFNMDVLATITPTASTGTVATTQDSARIANGTVPTASATYEGIILEVSGLTAPIVPTSGPLLNVGEMSNGDLVICENSNGTRQWKKLSDKGGNEHLLAGTRSSFATLRAANQLVPGRSYQITDHVQGRLVAGTTVTILATGTNEFGHQALVNTTYDDTSWHGLYDFDTAVVYELSDNRGNVVRGQAGVEVSNFDWGSTRFTNCTVDGATLTVTYGGAGSFIDITVDSGATLNVTGFTGSLHYSTFSNVASVNFTNANGTWRYNRIIGGGSFNASGYTGGGDNYYNEIDGASNINFSNSSSAVTFRQNHIVSATINHTGVSTGTFTLTNASFRQYTITHSAGALAFSSNGCEYFGYGTISHNVGTVTVNNLLCNGGNVNSFTTAGGSIVISGGELINSTYTNSSGGILSANRCCMRNNSTVTLTAGSLGTTTLTDCVFDSSASYNKLAASTSGNVSLTSCKFENNGFFQTSGTGNFTASQCTMSGSSRFNVTGGNRSYSFTRVDGYEVTQINLSGTGAGITDTFDDIHISARGVITDSSTGTAGNTFGYSTISGWSGGVTISGTTANQLIQRLTAEDGTLTISNCTVAMNHDLNFIRKAGNITISNLSVAKPVTYCEVGPQSSLTVTGTVAGLITRVTIYGRSCAISGAASTVNNLLIEQGTVNISGGSITNCSKKMNSTWTITGGAQNNTHHWNATNKTSAVNNTNRVDMLGMISSVPIL